MGIITGLPEALAGGGDCGLQARRDDGPIIPARRKVTMPAWRARGRCREAVVFCGVR